MKKILTLALLLGSLSSLFSQREIFVPKEPSGKWLEGNELYIKTEDSVVVKINFLETNAGFWIFEIEITNTSMQKEVLVAPELFYTNIEEFMPNVTRNLCEPQLRQQALNPNFFLGAGIDARRQLKKNTVYPQKTLYGLLFVNSCRHIQSFRFNLPIGNRTFSTVFEKKIER